MQQSYATCSKVCGHPSLCLTISPTSITNRCIKSSIHPYNLCRQTFSGWNITFLFQHEWLCTQRSPERSGLLHLVCRSELNQTFLGLIGTPTASQASSSNICAWPQWHFCVWKRANPSKAFSEVQLFREDQLPVNVHDFDEMLTVQQAHVSCLGVHIHFAMCFENRNVSCCFFCCEGDWGKQECLWHCAEGFGATHHCTFRPLHARHRSLHERLYACGTVRLWVARQVWQRIN